MSVILEKYSELQSHMIEVNKKLEQFSNDEWERAVPELTLNRQMEIEDKLFWIECRKNGLTRQAMLDFIYERLEFMEDDTLMKIHLMVE